MPLTDKELLRNVPLADVIPQEDNPRLNSETIIAVAESILRKGLYKDSIVVDEEMKIWCGDTTTKAIKFINENPEYFTQNENADVVTEFASLHAAWMAKYPGVIPEVSKVYGLSVEDWLEIRISDNKIPELSAWDIRKLQPQVVRLQEAGRKLAATGIPDRELRLILQGRVQSVREDAALQDASMPDQTATKKKCERPKIENFEDDGTVVDDDKRALMGETGHLIGDMPQAAQQIDPFDDPYVVHLAFGSEATALAWMAEHGLEDVEFDDNRRIVSVDMNQRLKGDAGDETGDQFQFEGSEEA